MTETAVCFGNCQALALEHLLHTNEAFTERFAFRTFPAVQDIPAEQIPELHEAVGEATLVLLQQVTEGTGTIIIKDETFNALGNGFIPDIPGLGGVLEGVHKLTESMAEELKGRVRVNAVLPSSIDTPANRKDMPDADPTKWVAPDDLAKVMLFLASDDARAVTGALMPVTGQV